MFIFHPQGIELKFRYPMCFIYRICKIVSFFLKVRSNSKITLIKTKYIVTYGKSNGGNNGYCVLEKSKATCSELKLI